MADSHEELERLMEQLAQLKAQEAYLKARYHPRFANRQAKNKYLYFIACGDAVKIGISDNPEARLKELQTGAPARMRIIAKFEQRGQDEATLHNQLAHLHLYGEWFRHTSEIDDLIKSLA